MSFNIYTDCKLSESALELLQKGLKGQFLIFPQKKSSSVLDISESDPRFDEAEIVLGAGKLLHHTPYSRRASERDGNGGEVFSR